MRRQQRKTKQVLEEEAEADRPVPLLEEEGGSRGGRNYFLKRRSGMEEITNVAVRPRAD
jgi:hypothetical protein